ncbi:hypothetical protein BKA81DRAFT_88899 [Phyllosticta paracitricarpa]|uniref:Uncharacterized protein n=1 Tax=Phyllosticta paracitricarpa TaxID=2016321 RepID=A0ABR1MZZ7_9PEZI
MAECNGTKSKECDIQTDRRAAMRRLEAVCLPSHDSNRENRWCEHCLVPFPSRRLGRRRAKWKRETTGRCLLHFYTIQSPSNLLQQHCSETTLSPAVPSSSPTKAMQCQCHSVAGSAKAMHRWRIWRRLRTNEDISFGLCQFQSSRTARSRADLSSFRGPKQGRSVKEVKKDQHRKTEPEQRGESSQKLLCRAGLVKLDRTGRRRM